MYEMPIFCCNDRYGNTLVSRPVITKMSTQQKVADAEFMAATQPWQRAAVTMRSLGAIRRCDNTTIRLCKAFAQHATGNIQHAAHKMQHTACSTQNATYRMHHATYTACHVQSATCNVYWATQRNMLPGQSRLTCLCPHLHAKFFKPSISDMTTYN